MESSQVLVTVAYALSALTAIFCDVATLVIVLGPVRRHRPDAYKGLLAWAIGSLVFAILWPLASMILVRLASSTLGVDGLLKVQAALAFGHVPIQVALVVALLRGLVRVAVPAPPAVLPETPVYR